MAAAVGERGSGGHAGMKRIILVEDDHDLRASLGDCLEEAGFAVALAGSAEQLHRELAAASFHVAVLDVNLPDASGYTLAAALPADMAVVMLTGRGSVADRVAGYDSGADLYLVKPTDGAELVAGIRAVLRDPGRRLTLDEVAFGPAGRAFAPLPGPLNLGRIEDAVWLRFSLAAGPGAPARVYLDLQPTILDRLTVYVPTGPGPGSAADFTAVQLGDHVPVVDRASTALAWIVPVDLASVPAPTIYLRIETTSIMVLRSDVRSDDGLIAAVGLNTALSSVFQGITLTMAAVSLVVGLWAGERLFLAYGLYLVLAAATYLFLNGFAQLVLPLMGGNLIDRLTKALVAVQPLAVGWLFWNLVEAGRRPLPWRIAFAAVMLIGAVGTVLLGIVLLGESASTARLISVTLIIAGIIGLKLSTP